MELRSMLDLHQHLLLLLFDLLLPHSVVKEGLLVAPLGSLLLSPLSKKQLLLTKHLHLSVSHVLR